MDAIIRGSRGIQARCAGVLVLVICMGATAASQEGSPRSNLTLIRECLGRTADSLAVALADVTPGALALRVEPAELSWFAGEPFESRLRDRGWVLLRGADAPWSIEVVVDDIDVAYSNPRREGLFASDVLDRTISARVRARAMQSAVDTPAVDARYSCSLRDTIAATDVEAVETSYLQFTQGQVPQAGFFSTVLEPVVVIGTIAVAVLLLFTVRSS